MKTSFSFEEQKEKYKELPKTPVVKYRFYTTSSYSSLFFSFFSLFFFSCSLYLSLKVVRTKKELKKKERLKKGGKK